MKTKRVHVIADETTHCHSVVGQELSPGIIDNSLRQVHASGAECAKVAAFCNKVEVHVKKAAVACSNASSFSNIVSAAMSADLLPVIDRNNSERKIWSTAPPTVLLYDYQCDSFQSYSAALVMFWAYMFSSTWFKK